MPLIICVLSIVLLTYFIYSVLNNNNFEYFRDIDEEAHRRELQQLFRDYYFYDYKNYNLDSIPDIDNDDFTTRYNHNQMYTVNNVSENTEYPKLIEINKNIVVYFRSFE